MKPHPIAWLNQPGFKGETLNPIRARISLDAKVYTGWHCEPAGPGCLNCYALAINRRFGTALDYVRANREGIFLDEKTLVKPLRWRNPRTIFWGDMSDLFGEWVLEKWLDSAFGIMLASENFDREPHRNIVLTKRPERMRAYLSTPAGALIERWARAVDETGWHSSPDEFFWEWVGSFCSATWGPSGGMVPGTDGDLWSHPENVFPLRNAWLGYSASKQEDLDPGMEDGDKLCPLAELMLCPSRLRWLSLEPLLGPIDLRILPCRACNHPGNVLQWPCPYCKGRRFEWPDWVVVGCESGPHRRRCEIHWVRSIVEQCLAAKVALFIKQLDIDGRVSHDPAEWPADLRVRKFPAI